MGFNSAFKGLMGITAKFECFRSIIRNTSRYCTVMSSVGCLDVPYFPHHLKNSKIFGKFIFIKVLSETLFIQRRRKQDIIRNIDKFSCTESVNFIRFKET
jgi:hypothetical protein